jgi:hypothetical protein
MEDAHSFLTTNAFPCPLRTFLEYDFISLMTSKVSFFEAGEFNFVYCVSVCMCSIYLVYC